MDETLSRGWRFGRRAVAHDSVEGLPSRLPAFFSTGRGDPNALLITFGQRPLDAAALRHRVGSPLAGWSNRNAVIINDDRVSSAIACRVGEHRVAASIVGATRPILVPGET